jgi:hypothetical protein
VLHVILRLLSTVWHSGCTASWQSSAKAYLNSKPAPRSDLLVTLLAGRQAGTQLFSCVGAPILASPFRCKNVSTAVLRSFTSHLLHQLPYLR